MKRIKNKKKNLNNYIKYYSIIRIVWLVLAILIAEVLNLYCESSEFLCACRNTSNFLGYLCYSFSLTYTIMTVYILLPIPFLLFIAAEILAAIISFTDEYNLKKLKVQRVFSIIFITSYVVIFLLTMVIVNLTMVIVNGTLSTFYFLPAILISIVMEIIYLVVISKELYRIEDNYE